MLHHLAEKKFTLSPSKEYEVEGARSVTRRLFDILSVDTQRLEAGALIIVENERTRVRLLPIMPGRSQSRPLAATKD
jgi:hypothetical protein